jgi:predicted MFS family arabinose efflux permease
VDAERREGRAETIGAAWYPLLILTLTYACHYIDRSILSIVIEPVKAEFRLNDRQVGFLSGFAYAIPYALAGIPVGILIDRYNRKNLLAGIVALWSGFTILAGMMISYPFFLVARMLVGAGESGASPTALAMLGDMFSERKRATAVSLYYLSIAIGTGASFILGGLVAVEYGWRAAFFVAGLPGLVLALVIFLTLKDPPRGDDRPAGTAPRPPASLPQTLRLAAGNKPLLHAAAGMILANVCASSFMVWIASYFIRDRGLAIDETGLLVGIGAGIMAAVGSVVGGAVADRFAVGRLSIVALTPAALFCAVFPAAVLMVMLPDVRLAAAAMMLLAFLLNSHFGPGYSLILSLAHPDAKGLTMAVVQVATNLLSFGMGPLLVGSISDAIGTPHSLGMALAITMSIAFWASFHYLLASRKLKAHHPS